MKYGQAVINSLVNIHISNSADFNNVLPYLVKTNNCHIS